MSLLKDSSLYLASAFVTSLVNFITLPFFTRYLTPTDYGLVALFIIFGNICANLVSFGLQSASYRFYFKFSIERFRIVNTTIFIFIVGIFFLVGFLVILPNLEWASVNIFNSELSPRLLAWSFVNGCLSYFFVYFSHMLAAQKRAKIAMITAIVHVVINAALTSYFILAYSLTYLAPIYAIFIANLSALLLHLYLNRNLFSFDFSVPDLRKALGFSYPEVPGMLIGLVYSSADKGMLNKYKGLESLGYYEFAAKFANLQKIFMDAISKSWMPFFFENAEKRTESSKKTIVKRFYELTFLFMFFGLGVAYFTEEALVVLTTEAYYQAKYVTPLLVMYYLMGILGFLSVQQLMFAEKLIYNLPVSAIGAVINVGLNIIWIPLYGAIGAAIATAITSFITSILLLYFSNKVYPLPLGAIRLVKLYLISGLFLLAGYPILMFDGSIFVKIFAKSVLLILFYAIGLRLNYFNSSDVNLISRKIFRLK